MRYRIVYNNTPIKEGVVGTPSSIRYQNNLIQIEFLPDQPVETSMARMPRPVPKPSQTKKIRGKKTIDGVE